MSIQNGMLLVLVQSASSTRPCGRSRNLFAAISVSVVTSVLARNTRAMHEMIGASIPPFDRALQAGGPMQQWLEYSVPARAVTAVGRYLRSTIPQDGCLLVALRHSKAAVPDSASI